MNAAHQNAWSSRFAFYLGVVGAAVGLGSIWRFPYLAGTSGGSAFIAVFVVAIVAIAIPLLVAEFMLGRASRRSAPQAAGAVARACGASVHWNAIGWLGVAASFLIMSYYTMIAGWVLAYAIKYATGRFAGLGPSEMARRFTVFLADPVEIAAWQLAFIAGTGAISSLGLGRGIERASRIRAPALLVLLLGLVAYALITGDVHRGLRFAFAPDFSKVSAKVVLTAIGQAFFATGVGLAMMITYGAYVGAEVSLLRSAWIVSGSILLVSLLATLLVFPLVFAFGVDPAQGPALVFDVLPRAFAVMPGGQFVATAFFLLLILAALTPVLAGLEPPVAWMEERLRMSRRMAVTVVAAGSWFVGLGSVLSFNLWKNWHPFAWVPLLREMNVFAAVDFIASNLLLLIGALLTSILVGWRIGGRLPASALAPIGAGSRSVLMALLRYVCPVALLTVLAAALTL